MINNYDNSPIDKKSIRKLNSEFNYIAIEVEYRKWIENEGVNEKEDTLYKHLCLLTDKYGMITTTVRYLIKTTRLAYRYILGGGWKNKKGNIIQVKGCLESLQNKGLIKYEKRGAENYLAVQILQVPKWEIAKHRFITVKVEPKKEDRDLLLKAIAEIELQINNKPENPTVLVNIKNRLLNDLKALSTDKHR